MKHTIAAIVLFLLILATVTCVRIGVVSANRASILKNSINQMDYHESSHTVQSEIQNNFAH